MTDLIARIESADGPDRELDAEIAKAVGAQGTYRADFLGWDDVGHAIYRPGYARYTASIDAALTLVPDDCGFVVMGKAAKVGCHIGSGATPALALAAAALKARGV